MNCPRNQHKTRPTLTSEQADHLLASLSKRSANGSATNDEQAVNCDQKRYFTFKNNSGSDLEVRISGVSVNTANQTNVTPKRISENSDLTILESTALGDSFKKQISKGKTLSNPLQTAQFCNDLNLLDNEVFTSQKLGSKQQKKSDLSKRVRSSSSNTFDHWLVTSAQENDSQAINQKVDWIKNVNNVGRKVLNVGLSREYIQSYKNIKSADSLNNSNCKSTDGQKAVSNASSKNQTLSNLKDSSSGFIENLRQYDQITDLKTELMLSNATPLTFKTFQSNDVEATPKKGNMKPALIPSALTTFYNRKVCNSAQRTSKSRPKVFDYCRYIESQQSGAKQLFFSKASESEKAKTLMQFSREEKLGGFEFVRQASQK